MNNYELMIIFTPILGEEEYQASQKKYCDFIVENGGEIVHSNSWGLKPFAYPIQKKTTGMYWVLEFTLMPNIIERFKININRDETILRHVFTKLDKHSIEYNWVKRNGGFAKKIIKEA